MYRIAFSSLLLALAGCTAGGNVKYQAGFFDAPTFADQQAEREACYGSKLCRAVIGQAPPVLFTALNSERVCIEHAFEASRRLEGVAGVEKMRIVVGARDVPWAKTEHAVLLVTYRGEDYVIDQGGLGTTRGAMKSACNSAAECRLMAGNSTAQPVCPEGVCAARDGMRDFVASSEPMRIWPEREGLDAIAQAHD